MKNLKLFFYLLTFTLIFTSCKNEDNDSSDEVSIVGEWKLSEYNGTSVVTSSTTGFPDFVTTTTAVGSDFNAYTTFTENPNLYSSTGTFTIDVNIVVPDFFESNQQILIDYDTIENDGTWEIINGNEFVGELINPQDSPLDTEDLTTEITELTNSTLKVRLYGSITDTVNGESSVTELEYFATYERQ